MARVVLRVPAGSVIVCAIGSWSVSAHVLTERPALGDWPGMPICTSYVVPGSSSTRLPRHSPLLGSYHMFRPWRNDESPDLRKMTAQPSAPGLVVGFQ